tara:strand:- start:394 stop:660 length:267 start_codon:yes stop_codon:yes gene_type:complete
MYVFIVLTILTISTPPIVENLQIYSTSEECYSKVEEIYEEKKKLKVNYPLEVEYKKDQNNESYMVYSFKPDYTRPKIVKYYQCKKISK